MNLSHSNVAPIIPVAHVATAVDFYEGRLGLKAQTTPGGVQLNAGGQTRAYLLETPDAAGSGEWPIASFLVDDLGAVVTELRDVGVIAIDAGAGFDLDQQGIARQDDMAVAWYRDPDGNVFTVFEVTG